MKQNSTAVLAASTFNLESQRRRLVRLKPTRMGALGLVFILAITLGGSCAPLFTSQDPVFQDLSQRLKPPVWADGTLAHPLGTDGLGRDELSRLLYGARLSLVIGLSTVILAGALGILLGLVAGYYGSWVDSLIMRIADIQLSVPFLVLAIAIVSVLGPGIRNVIIVLVLTGWVTYGRVIRAEVLALREREFIEAARTIGASNIRVMFRHILPNVVPSMIVVSTLEVARMILAEAGLSFLGLGVQPPDPEWGTMVADGRAVLAVAWWVSTLPGLAILITVLAINFVGDWLRDILDPTLRIT